MKIEQKEYRIKTIRELFELIKANEDKKDLILTDLKGHIDFVLKTMILEEEVKKQLGDLCEIKKDGKEVKILIEIQDDFIWIDDGKNDSQIEISIKAI